MNRAFEPVWVKRRRDRLIENGARFASPNEISC